MLPWPSLPRLRDSKHFRTLPGIRANLLLGMRFSFFVPDLTNNVLLAGENEKNEEASQQIKTVYYPDKMKNHWHKI